MSDAFVAQKKERTLGFAAGHWRRSVASSLGDEGVAATHSGNFTTDGIISAERHECVKITQGNAISPQGSVASPQGSFIPPFVIGIRPWVIVIREMIFDGHEVFDDKDSGWLFF